MGRLEGKVAIVTGATSGMGKRTAERFVEEGATVVVAGRREAEGEAVAKALGSRAHFVRTDVAREDDVRRLIGFAVDRFGRLDCLFNNAGGPGPRGGVATIPLDAAERSMAVNFGGVLLGMKHAAPVMARQRSGSIINNASVAASRAGYSSSMIYSAAKAAVVQLSRCAAMELGEHNVRVNCISPGAIVTGILLKALGLLAGACRRGGGRAHRAVRDAPADPAGGLGRRHREHGGVPGERRVVVRDGPGHRRGRRPDQRTALVAPAGGAPSHAAGVRPAGRGLT